MGILREEWQQTAAILAMLYNANRGEGAAAATWDTFNPTKTLFVTKSKDASPDDLAFCRNLFKRAEGA